MYFTVFVEMRGSRNIRDWLSSRDWSSERPPRAELGVITERVKNTSLFLNFFSQQRAEDYFIMDAPAALCFLLLRNSNCVGFVFTCKQAPFQFCKQEIFEEQIL